MRQHEIRSDLARFVCTANVSFTSVGPSSKVDIGHAQDVPMGTLTVQSVSVSIEHWSLTLHSRQYKPLDVNFGIPSTSFTFQLLHQQTIDLQTNIFTPATTNSLPALHGHRQFPRPWRKRSP